MKTHRSMLAMLLVAVCAIGCLCGDVSAQHRQRKKYNAAPPQLVVKSYAVADLIFPIPDSKSLQTELDHVRWKLAIEAQASNSPGDGIVSTTAAPPPERAKTLEAELMHTIVSTIAPETWYDAGGKGAIQYYPVGFAVVINQTPEVHQQIEQLLQSLRNCLHMEVALEVRILELAPNLAETFTRAAGFERLYPNDQRRCVTAAMLNDVQLAHWMESCQGDRKTNVMQAPKITVFNGQRAAINIGDEQVLLEYLKVAQASEGSMSFSSRQLTIGWGLFMQARPVILADRQNVRVDVDLKYILQELKGPATSEEVSVAEKSQGYTMRALTLDKSLTVPDGRTIVISLGKVLEMTHTAGATLQLSQVPGLRDLVAKCDALDVEVPLSRVPLVGGFFEGAKDEIEPREVFLLLTPRIVVNEESEASAFLGQLPRIPR